MTAITAALALALAGKARLAGFSGADPSTKRASPLGRKASEGNRGRRWRRRLETRESARSGARARRPAELARAAAAGSDDHPLAGSLLTAGGVWTVIVLTDDDDNRGRRFALNLVPPNRRPVDAIPFIVRVPRTVITQERPQTWAAELREQLAGWINTNAIERGEMSGGPPAVRERPVPTGLSCPEGR